MLTHCLLHLPRGRNVTRAAEKATLNGQESSDEAGPEGPYPTGSNAPLGSEADIGAGMLNSCCSALHHRWAQKITNPSWKQKKVGEKTGKHLEMPDKVHPHLAYDCKTKPKTALNSPAPFSLYPASSELEPTFRA